MTKAHSLPVFDGPDTELGSSEGGPKGTTSLRARHSPLAHPQAQVEMLAAVPTEIRRAVNTGSSSKTQI